MGENYCNNCIKSGHSYSHCKVPITSFGVIAFRYLNGIIQYLMICRKDTLGYIDFIRGKYQINNKHHILNMLKQMTVSEKNDLKTQEFDVLWKRIWGEHLLNSQYKNEETVSREKFNSLKFGVLVKNDFYTLSSLIDESIMYDNWSEPEWGFPKGRRNFQENDYDCALREFTEETGYDSHDLIHINTCLNFDETFTGSNYKSYKHTYFLMYMDNKTSIGDDMILHPHDNEVSNVEWKSFEDCLSNIRHYNIEKKRLITNINHALMHYSLMSSL